MRERNRSCDRRGEPELRTNGRPHDGGTSAPTPTRMTLHEEIANAAASHLRRERTHNESGIDIERSCRNGRELRPNGLPAYPHLVPTDSFSVAQQLFLEVRQVPLATYTHG